MEIRVRTPMGLFSITRYNIRMEALDREDMKKALKGQRLGRLTKEDLRDLRKEINKKLKPLEMTYGIKISLGRSIKFDSVSFRVRLEGTLLSPSGGESADAVHFKSLCWVHGLKPSDFGREITFPAYGKFPGRKGRITGINTRAKKYPILVTLEDGTKIKNAAHFVKGLLQ